MKSGMIAAESIFDLLTKSSDENKTQSTKIKISKTKNNFILNIFKV